MEDNPFISIDETANSDKSLDKEEAQKNLQNFQRQVFGFEKFIGPELLPGIRQYPINSDNFDEDALFGVGNLEANEDQVVPCDINHADDCNDGVSPTAFDKRNRYKSTKDDEINENDDENEVFDDNVTFEHQAHGLDTVDSSGNIFNRRSQSLPDLVLSSPEYSADSKNESLRGKYSPDVVMRKSAGKRNAEKLDNTEDKVADLKKVCNTEKPKFRRSVSFQDKPSEKIISPTYSAKQKRDSYRKSSGYGTGDSSIQSMNSSGSTMSRENSKYDGLQSMDHEIIPECVDQDHSKMLTLNRVDSGIQNNGNGNDSSFEIESESYGQSNDQDTNRPLLSIFNSDYSLSLNPTQSVNEKSFLKSEENKLPCGNVIPNFDLLVSQQDNQTVPLFEQPNTESISPMTFILKKYIDRISSSASSVSEPSPLSQYQSNPNAPSSHINTAPFPDTKSLSSILQQTDDPEIQHYVLQQFMNKFENMEEIISSKGASVLSDCSSTSSSLCHSGDSSNTGILIHVYLCS